MVSTASYAARERHPVEGMPLRTAATGADGCSSRSTKPAYDAASAR
ncbi:MAG: hypothetical protein R2734_14815 [Nocardioides sp.]